MPIYSESFAAAFGLLASSDRDLMEILALSINVSLASLVLSCLIGLPIGAFLAMRHFPMRDFLVGVFNAMMGLPPVVVGLLVYLHLSRSGPFGWLGLLYTPQAMVIAQDHAQFGLAVMVMDRHAQVIGEPADHFGVQRLAGAADNAQPALDRAGELLATGDQQAVGRR